MMRPKKLISTISCKMGGENESMDGSKWGRKRGVASVILRGGSVVRNQMQFGNMVALLGNPGSNCNTAPAAGAAPSAGRVVMTNCGWAVAVDFGTDCMLVVAVDWTHVKAIGSNDAVVTMVVDGADIETIGGKNGVVMGSDGLDGSAIG
uniref:Uncharacterized protein n=1 Tax=Romanomermis culicivorax TaxID=13658 RepID=A0A915HQT4_ROMCU